MQKCIKKYFLPWGGSSWLTLYRIFHHRGRGGGHPDDGKFHQIFTLFFNPSIYYHIVLLYYYIIILTTKLLFRRPSTWGRAWPRCTSPSRSGRSPPAGLWRWYNSPELWNIIFFQNSQIPTSPVLFGSIVFIVWAKRGVPRMAVKNNTITMKIWWKYDIFLW